MDSFEFNKIAMAVLGTVFVIFSASLISEGIFHSEAPEQPAYVIAEVTDGADDAGADTGPAFEPVEPLLASADIGAGENVFKKCASCHTLDKGGENKVGPNLYDIVGGEIAAKDGFSYSAALSAYAEGRQWTYEELNGFLWKPKTYVSGTAMGFVGLKDVQDRADVIAYLRGFADNPPPIPDPEQEVADDQSGDAEAGSQEGAADADGNEEAGESGQDGSSAESDSSEGTTADGEESDPASEDSAVQDTPLEEEEGESQ